MNIIKRTTSFWLNWKNDTLIDRIAGSRKRPKVQNLTTKELNDMINKRAIIYREAKYKIECDDLNKNEISKKILSLYIDEKISVLTNKKNYPIYIGDSLIKKIDKILIKERLFSNNCLIIYDSKVVGDNLKIIKIKVHIKKNFILNLLPVKKIKIWSLLIKL